MNAQPKRMSPEEFLAWAERQPKDAGTFELWDGAIVEKHGPAGTVNAERSQHWRMKGALYRALHASLKQAALDGEVVVDGASVRLPEGRLCEPDVLVYLGPRVAKDRLVVDNPVIVAEILSPWTADFDRGVKRDGLLGLPSVMHYLIGDPDEMTILHHVRGTGATWTTNLIRSRSASLRLNPPGLDVDLSEVFEP